MTCICTHIALAHRYVLAARSNAGACLASGCVCERCEEAGE